VATDHTHPEGAEAPTTARYAVCTRAGTYLGVDVLVAEGHPFPPSAEVAGPGVEVRYVLIEPRGYLAVAA
jgi:hypothetical protein